MVTKQIDTLVTDIHKLFDEGTSFTDLAVEQFSKALSNNLVERFKEYGTPRQRRLSMSNIGKPARQLWFELVSGLPGEPLGADTKFKFLYGDILEDMFLALAVQAGHTVELLQHKVEYDGVPGSIDATIDGVLVDVKSCSSYSYDKFRYGTIKSDDPFGYIGQLSGYAKALGAAKACFIPIDKVTGNFCLYWLTEEDIKNYDLEAQIASQKLMLQSKTPPEKLCYEPKPDGKSGNLKLPTGCSYCSHKWNCHPQLRGFIYSSGPVYLTKVERVPNVPEFTKGY